MTWYRDGLLRGNLSRYGAKGGDWDIAEQDWIAVCLAAHRLWKDEGLRRRSLTPF